jgi:predicted GNAT family acetyltransferase
MTTEVRNAVDRSRYELLLHGDLVGVADYRIDGDTIVFSHTEIDAQLRGNGLGALLVSGALDDVRTTGRAVRPVCWFVREFIETHKDYADLQAA